MLILIKLSSKSGLWWWCLKPLLFRFFLGDWPNVSADRGQTKNKAKSWPTFTLSVSIEFTVSSKPTKIVHFQFLCSQALTNMAEKTIYFNFLSSFSNWKCFVFFSSCCFYSCSLLIAKPCYFANLQPVASCLDFLVTFCLVSYFLCLSLVLIHYLHKKCVLSDCLLIRLSLPIFLFG